MADSESDSDSDPDSEPDVGGDNAEHGASAPEPEGPPVCCRLPA